MAVDAVGVFDELYAQLVGFRRRMVAHSPESRRFGSIGKGQQFDEGTVCPRSVLVHFVFPVQRRDSAHDR